MGFDIGEFADKVLPKLNWPAVFLVLGAATLYFIFLAPDYITQDDLDNQTKELKEAIRDQETTDLLTGNTIETINKTNDRQDDDIRELRSK